MRIDREGKEAVAQLVQELEAGDYGEGATWRTTSF